MADDGKSLPGDSNRHDEYPPSHAHQPTGRARRVGAA